MSWGKTAHAHGELVRALKAQVEKPRLERNQAGDQVARIDRGHAARIHRQRVRRLIPVIEVAVPLFHALERRRRQLETIDAASGVSSSKSTAPRIEHRKADIGRRGAARKPRRAGPASYPAAASSLPRSCCRGSTRTSARPVREATSGRPPAVRPARSADAG